MLSVIGALVLYWLLHISLWGLFVKAGKPGWHSAVPFLQDMTLLEIAGKNKRSAWWGLIPYINFLFNLSWLSDLLYSFNRQSFWEHSIGVIFGFVYFPVLVQKKDVQYIEKADRPKKVKKSSSREWADAIFFALVAATLIRTFNIEAYRIPSQSMEGTLLAGDFLFVSKMHYGARFPMTPLAFPLGHQTFPLTDIKCYFDKPSLPYFRFPGFQKVKRGDAVVFNYPMEDDRPVDKKTNYIKRCVGLPGETLSINHGQLVINGENIENPDHLQFQHTVNINQKGINPERLKELEVLNNEIYMTGNPNSFIMFLEEGQAECIRQMPGVDLVQREYYSPTVKQNVAHTFPGDTINYKWSVDFFGPLLIPAKGMTIKINTENIALYARAIRNYEGNTLEIKHGKILINGNTVDQYTFKQNYYFMMGDNRHNSEDSRFWGLVPEDHIVGKAWMVWMCIQPEVGFRLDRFLKFVQGDRIQKSKILCP